MDSISRAAVENAYSNSGMIFAQFLHGFAHAVRDKQQFNFREFADSFAEAVRHAYEAVLLRRKEQYLLSCALVDIGWGAGFVILAGWRLLISPTFPGFFL